MLDTLVFLLAAVGLLWMMSDIQRRMKGPKP
jgi:hypothetical protein